MRNILAVGFLVASSVVPVLAQARAPVAGYASVGDTRLYYEVRGAGDPILLLHGGGGSVERSWPKEYDALGNDFMLIKVDSRGHGRSADGAGPLTYGRLAADVVRLLDHLNLPRAHVVGHSMGAITALHLLVDYPDRIRTATLLAGTYHVDTYNPPAYAAMKLELDRLLRGEKLESRWTATSLPVLQKLHDSLLTGPTLTLRTLQTIRQPVLIVTAGLDDFFSPAIGEQMRANLRDSELIHYPAATHRVQVTNSKELVPAIRDFIARRAR
jgi:pimeloyl-ACP methyl ester carboxylesterase